MQYLFYYIKLKHSPTAAHVDFFTIAPGFRIKYHPEAYGDIVWEFQVRYKQ